MKWPELTLTSFPMELLQEVGECIVDTGNPKILIKHFTVCHAFYQAFRPMVYGDINFMLFHTYYEQRDHLFRDYNLIPHTESVLDLQCVPHHYHGRMLITNPQEALRLLRKMCELTSLRESVRHLHISGFNFEFDNEEKSASITELMKSHAVYLLFSEIPQEDDYLDIEYQNFYLFEHRIRNAVFDIFEIAMMDFLTSPARMPTLETSNRRPRHFLTSDELEVAYSGMDNLFNHPEFEERGQRSLFQPKKWKRGPFDVKPGLTEVLKLAMVLISRTDFLSCSIAVLNTINIQEESNHTIVSPVVRMTFQNSLINVSNRDDE